VSTVVWISGASSGIGAALTRTGPAGARIIGIARRPSASGESILADLSDPASWDGVCRVIEDVLTAERPDRAMFLHFAGTAIPMGPATTADPGEYRAAVLVNSAAGQVLGTSFLAACERHAIAATVVMCSSPAATHPRSGMTHYAGGKAALEQWTRTLALEQQGAARPARVFSVVPYGVDTPMVRAAMEEPAETLPLGQYFREAAAAGRLTDPVSTAREIWALVEGDVEPGAAVPVGAVPDGV
jgi:benzil reductase ((S)-benzoin forming)